MTCQSWAQVCIYSKHANFNHLSWSFWTSNFWLKIEVWKLQNNRKYLLRPKSKNWSITISLWIPRTCLKVSSTLGENPRRSINFSRDVTEIGARCTNCKYRRDPTLTGHTLARNRIFWWGENQLVALVP